MNPDFDDAQAARDSFEALSRRLMDKIAAPLDLGETMNAAEMLKSLTAGLAHDTDRWLALQNRYYRRQLELWAAYAGPQPGTSAASADADPGDRRFRAQEWHSHPYFEYLSRSYLLAGEWLREAVEASKLEAQAKRKLQFF